MSKVEVGQRWRTEDGYLYDIVAVKNGFAYGRHPNSKSAPTQVNLGWFKQWDRVK